jgi:hypothetical protein
MNEDFLALEQFPAAIEKVESFFYVDRCLPEQVFKRPYRFYLMRQFDGGSMWDFMDVLQKLHSPLANDTVLFNVLDPHPIDYFYKHFGKISAFSFKADITEPEYYAMRWLNPGNEADAIASNSNVETYIPSSGAWAMWGERGREISVLGLDDLALAFYLVQENRYWTDAETAINGFASQPYRDHKVPEGFRGALISNYGNTADLEAKLDEKLRDPWER